jgi:hypothetical protein
MVAVERRGEGGVALGGAEGAGQQRRGVEAAAGQGLDGCAELVVETEGADELDLLGRELGQRQADRPGRQHPELHDPPARPHAVETGGERLRIAGSLESYVKPALVGLIGVDPGGLRGDVDGLVRADPAGDRERRLGDVRDRDARGAGVLRGEAAERADRARARDQHLAAEQVAGAAHRVQADCERLGQRRDGVRRRPRHDEALALEHHQLLLERALDVGHDRSTAEKGHPPAEVAAAGLTGAALPARQARVDRDPVALLDPADVAAGLDHVARDLVAEDQGLAHREVADPPLAIVMQVGAADAAGAEPEPDLVRPERRRRALLEAQVPGTMQHADSHPLLPGACGHRPDRDDDVTLAHQVILRQNGTVACRAPRAL